MMAMHGTLPETFSRCGSVLSDRSTGRVPCVFHAFDSYRFPQHQILFRQIDLDSIRDSARLRPGTATGRAMMESQGSSLIGAGARATWLLISRCRDERFASSW